MKRTKKKRLSICLSFALVLSLFYTVSPANPAKVVKAAGYGLSNPRIDSDGVATWDCVYFGNYWQNDTNGDGKADKNDAKQPIKWRVLSVDGDDAFLLADQNLDCQQYNEEYTKETWETCTLRQWLNSDFYQNAFDSSEQSAIQTTTVVNEDNPEYGTEGGNNTSDKVYLLSVGEASNAAYGFHSMYSEASKTREAKNTEYAKECGADTISDGNGWWWLRSPGYYSYDASHVYYGYVDDYGNDVDYGSFVVRPALHLNLSSTKWSKAGTISSSGAGSAEVTPTGVETITPTPTVTPTQDGDLSNPRIDSDGVAEWECIYFGNYWQSDTNGDGKVDKNDAKQPIKWRVLSVDGDDAFLLADQNLDCQPYNEKDTDVTWETCTLRQWLNDDFYQNAFDSSEQSAIQTTTVVNDNNLEYGTEGGNNTRDKVYLLSISEASNAAYGFCSTYDKCSETREAKNTEYAKECGAYTSSTDSNGWWWLRSPGYSSNYAASIDYHGYVNGPGFTVDYDSIDYDSIGVRPALHLNLSSNKWSQAGTVSLYSDVAEWECIYFGNYWQNDTNGDGKADKNDAKQPIKWRVLSVDGDDAFLLADQNLDCQPYNEEYTDVTWETCTLRQWLNDDFYQNAFDSSEQSAIRTTTVVNEDNPYYGTEGGNNTSDKVYLLSIGEASNAAYGFCSTYDKYSETREAKNTEYAKECGAYTISDSYAGNGRWWLRSPGDDSRYAALVGYYGYGYVGGSNVDYSIRNAVRPALHLKLSSSKWSKAGTVSSSVGESAGETPTPIVTPTPTPTGGETTEPTPTATPDNGETPTPIVTQTPPPTGGETTEPTPTATPDNEVTPTPIETATPTPTGGETTPLPTVTPDNKEEIRKTQQPEDKPDEKVTPPAKPTSLKAINKKGRKLSLSWKKVKGAGGYQIQYATNNKFKKKKSKLIKKTKYTIKKLKKKKTYYIRIRAYKWNGAKKVYGKWSKVKRIKIKK